MSMYVLAHLELAKDRKRKRMLQTALLSVIIQCILLMRILS